MISTNKKREETSSKTYTVERLLKQRKRKGRIEYLVKWKHYDKSHNSWEPEGNILDKSLIDSYKKQIKSISRRTLSPKKSIRNQNDDISSVKNDSIHECDEQLEKEDDNNKQEKTINSTSIDYWYPPPICEQKAKIAITDITSDNVTITFRELI
ncbi:unnamed protein product [Rotaria sp. Silwood1]|nr:unnamed protein product [Rotaria sp. Silwood1]CAF0965086.1 unnamed protein product [Rotaria sp. Silwood1]CAF0974371.1 unnamed protein product [Rotaria sp. Silwood1]CAF3381237.1 unnamed protein product [Rotaria sp. Silwood1]CAF3405145.1 unnamed protein product [Rotaria sp. Silwood1]